jgi:hypothetical protein
LTGVPVQALISVTFMVTILVPPAAIPSINVVLVQVDRVVAFAK